MERNITSQEIFLCNDLFGFEFGFYQIDFIQPIVGNLSRLQLGLQIDDTFKWTCKIRKECIKSNQLSNRNFLRHSQRGSNP